MTTSKTSLIEEHEIEEAKGFISEQLGFPTPAALGDKLIVKIYLRPEEISTFTTDDGRTISIYAPPQLLAKDRFRNCTALVIAVGDDCYKHPRYAKSGPYCRVGDWIVIPRNVGIQMNYRGVPVQVIPEWALFCVIEEPTHIQRS